MNAKHFLYHMRHLTGISFRTASLLMNKSNNFVSNLACRNANYHMDNIISIASAFGYEFQVRKRSTNEVLTGEANDVLQRVCAREHISTNVLSHKLGNISDSLGSTFRRNGSLLVDTYVRALDIVGYDVYFFNIDRNDCIKLDNKPSIDTDGLQG